MTLYLVCEAELPLMAGYNHSQEYLGQNFDLILLVRKAFATCALYVSARVRRNAFCTIQNLKRFSNSHN